MIYLSAFLLSVALLALEITWIRILEFQQWAHVASMVISLAGSELYRLMAACAGAGIPWRSLRLSLCAVSSLAFVAAGRADIFSDTALSLWDVAAGDIILREAGGPAIVDYRGTPLFPHYVHRRLRLDDRKKFPCIAASCPELIAQPMGTLVSAAGLLTPA